MLEILSFAVRFDDGSTRYYAAVDSSIVWRCIYNEGRLDMVVAMEEYR